MWRNEDVPSLAAIIFKIVISHVPIVDISDLIFDFKMLMQR